MCQNVARRSSQYDFTSKGEPWVEWQGMGEGQKMEICDNLIYEWPIFYICLFCLFYWDQLQSVICWDYYFNLESFLIKKSSTKKLLAFSGFDLMQTWSLCKIQISIFTFKLKIWTLVCPMLQEDSYLVWKLLLIVIIK